MRRLKFKKKERQRSVIAKELLTSGKYKAKVVKDRRGRDIDLDKLTHRDLIELFQGDDDA